jgi:hypothetical protein
LLLISVLAVACHFLPFSASSLLFVWLLLEIVLGEVAVAVDAVVIFRGLVFFCVMAM